MKQDKSTEYIAVGGGLIIFIFIAAALLLGMYVPNNDIEENIETDKQINETYSTQTKESSQKEVDHYMDEQANESMQEHLQSQEDAFEAENLQDY